MECRIIGQSVGPTLDEPYRRWCREPQTAKSERIADTQGLHWAIGPKSTNPMLAYCLTSIGFAKKTRVSMCFVHRLHSLTVDHELATMSLVLSLVTP